MMHLIPLFKKTCLALLIIGFLFAIPAPVTAETGQQSDNCGECHEDQVTAFKQTSHATENCISCHGDAAKHIEESGGKGTIFAFGSQDLAIASSKKCLECHKDSNARYFASAHGKASLSCTNCHRIHSGHSHTGSDMSATKSCYGCHEDTFAQFKLNERHRLQEGILGCTTCHNPHEPAIRERLNGIKHEACIKCHTDKGGPFLYEHAASRIEGCGSCHEVHGSPNRHMLHFQSTAELCFSCHVEAPAWHERFKSVETNCTVCHSTIHGSNLSNIFLK